MYVEDEEGHYGNEDHNTADQSHQDANILRWKRGDK